MTITKDKTHHHTEDLKSKAKRHLEQGAVTADYPLDVKEVCKILNGFLATEIVCVLRYRHHQIITKGIDKPQVSAEFKEHALEEEKHMLMIAERINQLGGNPDFNPMTIKYRSVTEYGKDELSLRQMLEDDLIAERIVISEYRKYIAWFGMKDSTSRKMLEHILRDEENHANDLADLLHDEKIY